MIFKGRILTFAYMSLLFFICAVSSIDLYWSVVLGEELIEVEQNPLGSFLIRVDNDRVALFMATKSFGTSLVVGLLVFLYFFRKRTAWCVIIPLSIFQLCLLLYMYSGNREGAKVDRSEIYMVVPAEQLTQRVANP